MFIAIPLLTILFLLVVAVATFRLAAESRGRDEPCGYACWLGAVLVALISGQSLLAWAVWP